MGSHEADIQYWRPGCYISCSLRLIIRMKTNGRHDDNPRRHRWHQCHDSLYFFQWRKLALGKYRTTLFKWRVTMPTMRIGTQCHGCECMTGFGLMRAVRIPQKIIFIFIYHEMCHDSIQSCTKENILFLRQLGYWVKFIQWSSKHMKNRLYFHYGQSKDIKTALYFVVGSQRTWSKLKLYWSNIYTLNDF